MTSLWRHFKYIRIWYQPPRSYQATPTPMVSLANPVFMCYVERACMPCEMNSVSRDRGDFRCVANFHSLLQSQVRRLVLSSTWQAMYWNIVYIYCTFFCLVLLLLYDMYSVGPPIRTSTMSVPLPIHDLLCVSLDWPQAKRFSGGVWSLNNRVYLRFIRSKVTLIFSLWGHLGLNSLHSFMTQS